MELKEIKAVLELINKYELGEFELEKSDFKLRVKRNADPQQVVVSSPPSLPFPTTTAYPSGTSTASTQEVQESTEPKAIPTPQEPQVEIVSPMVGTFYTAPSPDSQPYVKIGDEVKEDTVVCIIEAMKVMNEIKAEASGTVVEILAENGKPIEFGKALFALRPAK